MPELACIFSQQHGRWVLVSNNDQVQFNATRVARIQEILSLGSEMEPALRRYLQRVFKGRVSLKFGSINRRRWCLLSLNETAQPSQNDMFSEAIYRQITGRTKTINIESLVNLFSQPVALVNCRTGRSVLNRMWVHGLETLTALQRDQLQAGMQQLCRSTPQGCKEVTIDTACGVMLLAQQGAAVGAWRMMLWYAMPQKRREHGDCTVLTRAERQVCDYIFQGISISEIAEKRHTSLHTTRTQLRSVYRKLGVGNQQELLIKLQVAPHILQQ